MNLFTFLELSYQKVVKSLGKFSHQSVKMSLYTIQGGPKK